MDTLSKIIKKLAALLENIGYGLIGSAAFMYLTETDSSANTNVVGALVIGFVSLIAGALIDIYNTVLDGK